MSNRQTHKVKMHMKIQDIYLHQPHSTYNDFGDSVCVGYVIVRVYIHAH